MEKLVSEGENRSQKIPGRWWTVRSRERDARIMDRNHIKRQWIDQQIAIDRVCRNMRDAMRMQELEDKHGVALAFVDNQFGPGPAGALSFNVNLGPRHRANESAATDVVDLRMLEKRRILEIVSLSRRLGDVSLELERRKPVKPGRYDSNLRPLAPPRQIPCFESCQERRF